MEGGGQQEVESSKVSSWPNRINFSDDGGEGQGSQNMLTERLYYSEQD